MDYFKILPEKGALEVSMPDGSILDSIELIGTIARAMADKMLRNHEKYGWSNEWKHQDWEADCRRQMMEHIQKGDPMDVVIYAAFMYYRNWTTKAEVAYDITERAEAFVEALIPNTNPEEYPADRFRQLDARDGYIAGATEYARRIEEMEAQRDEVMKRAEEIQTERIALQRFKDFVHKRLDDMGIPTHPDGEHSKAGCRIGDRLDIVESYVRYEIGHPSSTHPVTGEQLDGE